MFFELVGESVKYSINDGDITDIHLRSFGNNQYCIYHGRDDDSSVENPRILLRIYAESITKINFMPYTETSYLGRISSSESAIIASTIARESNDMNNIFDTHTSLNAVTNIPDNLPDAYKDYYRYGWRYCSKVVAIAEPFGKICRHITSMKSTFAGLDLSEGICDDLFVNTPNISSVERCFSRTSINEIPNALFAPCKNIVNFAGCFSGCASLQSLPTELFLKNKIAEDFSWCFGGCTSITAIPDGIFSGITSAVDFSSCFCGCTNVNYIGHGLFSNCENAMYFEFTFAKVGHNQYSALHVYSDIFLGCINAVDFTCCFYYLFHKYNSSEISSIFDISPNIIDGGLFFSCVRMQILTGCFAYSFITSLPFDLFYTASTRTVPSIDFSWCFYNTYITAIPDSLFSMCREATKFRGTFAICAYIQSSIPEDLFRQTTNAVDFSSCFYAAFDCEYIRDNTTSYISDTYYQLYKHITIIPETLFATTADAIDFSWCFGEIHGYRYNWDDSKVVVPENLFWNCTKAKTFQGCFYLTPCLHIKDIFKNAVEAEDFSYCFAGWYYTYNALTSTERVYKSNRAISIHIFDNVQSAATFEHCFEDQHYACFSDDGSGGEYLGDYEDINAMPLWSMYPNAVGTKCFANAGYNLIKTEVPDEWK